MRLLRAVRGQLTSTREPSRLMTDIRRSTVNRARSALRMREVGGGNPCASVRGANAQALTVERFDNFRSKNRLELFDIGALVPKVPENISASANEFQLLVLHHNISLSRFNRSLIKSISCLRRLDPWVDFF